MLLLELRCSVLLGSYRTYTWIVIAGEQKTEQVTGTRCHHSGPVFAEGAEALPWWCFHSFIPYYLKRTADKIQTDTVWYQVLRILPTTAVDAVLWGSVLRIPLSELAVFRPFVPPLILRLLPRSTTAVYTLKYSQILGSMRTDALSIVDSNKELRGPQEYSGFDTAHTASARSTSGIMYSGRCLVYFQVFRGSIPRILRVSQLFTSSVHTAQAAKSSHSQYSPVGTRSIPYRTVHVCISYTPGPFFDGRQISPQQ